MKKKQFDVIVTTYEAAKNNFNDLKRINWEYLVIDEGHKIKNEESLLSIVYYYLGKIVIIFQK